MLKHSRRGNSLSNNLHANNFTSFRAVTKSSTSNIPKTSSTTQKNLANIQTNIFLLLFVESRLPDKPISGFITNVPHLYLFKVFFVAADIVTYIFVLVVL